MIFQVKEISEALAQPWAFSPEVIDKLAHSAAMSFDTGADMEEDEADMAITPDEKTGKVTHPASAYLLDMMEVINKNPDGLIMHTIDGVILMWPNDPHSVLGIIESIRLGEYHIPEADRTMGEWNE